MKEPKYYFYATPVDFAGHQCPQCTRLTKEKKFCFMVHYQEEDTGFYEMISYHSLCRYCTGCKLILSKKTGLENFLNTVVEEDLHRTFDKKNYIVFGTMDQRDRERGQQGVLQDNLPVVLLAFIHPFIDVLEFKVQLFDWYLNPN